MTYYIFDETPLTKPKKIEINPKELNPYPYSTGTLIAKIISLHINKNLESKLEQKRKPLLRNVSTTEKLAVLQEIIKLTEQKGDRFYPCKEVINYLQSCDALQSYKTRKIIIIINSLKYKSICTRLENTVVRGYNLVLAVAKIQIEHLDVPK